MSCDDAALFLLLLIPTEIRMGWMAGGRSGLPQGSIEVTTRRCRRGVVASQHVYFAP